MPRRRDPNFTTGHLCRFCGELVPWGTILRLITLPLTILTFGLFLIVINAFLLEITDWLTSDFTVDDFFWDAILAAIIIGLTTAILDYAFRGLKKK